jgi:pimeloyl-ACP methyl ester carboxylesterase
MPHMAVIGLLVCVGALVVLLILLVGVSCYFLHVFSRSHVPLNDTFDWGLPTTTPEPPALAQRVVRFAAADGTQLCADFWAQQQPAPTIILCHGYRITRKHLRPVAALQYARGYNVLSFDFRGHGESARAVISVGSAEVRDLQAAIVVARAQAETLPGQIILYGFSMGASVALLTPPTVDVAAVIADSPYARSDEVIQRAICSEARKLLKRGPACLHGLCCLAPGLARVILAISALIFRARFGYPLVARADLSLQQWRCSLGAFRGQSKPTPLLLVHAIGDELIPVTHSYTLAAIATANAIPVATCFVKSNAHCGSYGHNPRHYNKVLARFLASHAPLATPPAPAAPRTAHHPTA